MLKLIVCVDAENGIGLNNKLPWNIKAEMQHFKNTTTNHTIVMGRKTFESIGRVLPNRKNIILSHDQNLVIEGAIVTNKIQKIINLSKSEDVYVIGGKSIYKLFLEFCQILIISRLSNAYQCDTFFDSNLKGFQLDYTEKFEEFSVEYYSSLRHKILSGKVASEVIKTQLLDKKNRLVDKYKTIPHLAIIQVGNDFASDVYIRNKVKLGDDLGIKVTHHLLGVCTEQLLLDTINQLNEDKSVHGILVQLPLLEGMDATKIANAILPVKDVDCFHAQNIGQLWTDPFSNENNIIPCTPYGIIKLLEFYNISLAGKNVAIIGRSNIVGKPLISLCLAKQATVKVCHSKTNNLVNECQWADILIVAIGKPKFINSSHIKNGAVVVDVGINRDANNQLCGDVDFDDVISKASAITPVPFGIGPMTLIMLFNNLLNAYLNCSLMI